MIHLMIHQVRHDSPDDWPGKTWFTWWFTR